jgi:hypothetical protein
MCAKSEILVDVMHDYCKQVTVSSAMMGAAAVVVKMRGVTGPTARAMTGEALFPSRFSLI